MVFKFVLRSTYRWIEQATADPVESPCRDGQGEAEGKSDEQELAGVWCSGWSDHVGDLGAAKGEEEEEKSSNELAGRGDEVLPDLIGRPVGVGVGVSEWRASCFTAFGKHD